MHLELDTTRTEDLVCRTDVELHVGDVKFLLVVVLHLADLLLPVLMHDLPLGVFVVLVLRQHVRRGDVRVAYLCADDIRPAFRLVLHSSGDIIRVGQVQRTLRHGQLTVVLCPELLHFRRCPYSAVRLRHIIRRLFGSYSRRRSYSRNNRTPCG